MSDTVNIFKCDRGNKWSTLDGTCWQVRQSWWSLLFVVHGWPAGDPRDFPHKYPESGSAGTLMLPVPTCRLPAVLPTGEGRYFIPHTHAHTHALSRLGCAWLLPALIKCPLRAAAGCSRRQRCQRSCRAGSRTWQPANIWFFVSFFFFFPPLFGAPSPIQEATAMKTILAAYSGVLKGKRALTQASTHTHTHTHRRSNKSEVGGQIKLTPHASLICHAVFFF